MGGADHGLWAPGKIFTVCSDCAAREAAVKFPNMKVRK